MYDGCELQNAQTSITMVEFGFRKCGIIIQDFTPKVINLCSKGEWIIVIFSFKQNIYDNHIGAAWYFVENKRHIENSCIVSIKKLLYNLYKKKLMYSYNLHDVEDVFFGLISYLLIRIFNSTFSQAFALKVDILNSFRSDQLCAGPKSVQHKDNKHA